MPACKILIAVLARGHYERCEIRDFILGVYCSGNPLVGKIINATVDRSPTTTARNNLVGECFRQKFAPKDKVLMIDHDMVPSTTFFDHALKFLNEYHGPTVIGSPYCGAAPDCEVQVCEQDQNGIVRRVTHDEAAERHGTRPTMMVGTGMMMANMAAFEILKRPYFDYSYETPDMEVASQTEDFYFCANLLAAGGRVFCSWDHWSGHDKPWVVGKPVKKPDDA